MSVVGRTTRLEAAEKQSCLDGFRGGIRAGGWPARGTCASGGQNNANALSASRTRAAGRTCANVRDSPAADQLQSDTKWGVVYGQMPRDCVAFATRPMASM